MQSTQSLQAGPTPPHSTPGGNSSAVPVSQNHTPPPEATRSVPDRCNALKRQPVMCPWPNADGFKLLFPLSQASDRADTSAGGKEPYPVGTGGYTPVIRDGSAKLPPPPPARKGIPLQPTRKLIDPNYGLPGWGHLRPPRKRYVPKINLAALTHVSPPVHATDYAHRPAPKLDEVAPWLQDPDTINRIECGGPHAVRAESVPASASCTNTSSTTLNRTTDCPVILSSSQVTAARQSPTRPRPSTPVKSSTPTICDYIVSSPTSIGSSPSSGSRTTRHGSASPSNRPRRISPAPRTAYQEAIDRLRMPPPPVPVKRSVSSSPPLPISPPRGSTNGGLPSLRAGQKRKAETQLTPETLDGDSDGDTEVDSNEEPDDDCATGPQVADVGIKRSMSKIPKDQIDLSEPRTRFPLPSKPTPGPVAVLPMPLPSKRAKKTAKSKSILLPYDQLPTYPLPPLPEIPDPELRKRVFTHAGLFEKHRGRFEEPGDEPAQHYEKLEHVGDSILGMVVTTWLGEAKPTLTPGSATKLKAMLVSNATLSHFSGQYNLPQRLVADPEFLPVLRATTDVRAALVEAYIAAIYYSYPVEDRRSVALEIIDNWLREMYEPMFDFCYNYMKAENRQFHLASAAGLDGTVELLTEEQMLKIDAAAKGMAPLVTMYCHRQNRQLTWEEEQFETYVGTLCKIKCCVDGVELGEGTRSSRKAAKSVAAHEAAKKLGLVTEEAVPTSEAAFR